MKVNKLLAARKIAFNSLRSHTTGTMMFQLGKQNLIVKSDNCFRKILNHSYSRTIHKESRTRKNFAYL